jgi:uncharacterized protein (TIRG00374 family)
MKLPGFLSKHKSSLFLILGSIAFIAYLEYFVKFDSLIKLLTSLNLAQYSLYYSLAILSLVLMVFFDSLIFYYLLQGLKVKIKLTKMILYNWIGNFVEMVIPCETVCGEVTRIYLIQKDTKSNIGTSAAPVISSRIISTVIYTAGLLVGSIFLVFGRPLPLYLLGTLLVISFGTVGIIGVFFYIALKNGADERLVNAIMRLLKVITKNQAKLDKRKEKLQTTIFSFTEAFKTYKKNPKLLIKPTIFAAVGYIFNLLVFLMVFYALNFRSITLPDLAVVYFISSTVETITSGFPVGAVEITMINLYSALNVPLVIAGAATTLSRLLTFWVQVLIGYPLVQFTGLKQLVKNGLSSDALFGNQEPGMSEI